MQSRIEEKQPRASIMHDEISEKRFLDILADIESRILSHDGLVHPGSKALIGLNSLQIQRLLAYCEEYDGDTFHFSGYALESEVLTSLLMHMATYKLKNSGPCKLDLSGVSLNDAKVISALGYFIEHAQSQWALILDNCRLELTPKLSEQFIASNKIYSLSIKGNPLKGDQASNFAAILRKSSILEEIAFADNELDSLEFLNVAEGISKSVSVRTLHLSADDLIDLCFNDASMVVNCLLKNSHVLQEVHLSQKSHSLLRKELKLCVNEVNPRIKILHLENLPVHPDFLYSVLTCNFPGLKSLSLYQCELTNELLQIIAAALNTYVALEELLIDDTRGLHLGQSAIFEAVSNNNTLKKLILPDYNFSDRRPYNKPQVMVAQALQKLFRDNRTLIELNIEACNLISAESAEMLADVFEFYNRVLSRIAFRNVIKDKSALKISQQVSSNELLQRITKPLVIAQINKENKLAVQKQKKETFLSHDAFTHLLNQLKELIDNKEGTLKFKKNKSEDYSTPSKILAKDPAHYISGQQLEKLMTLAAIGTFSGIDFSNESHLPPKLNGIILKKIREYFSPDLTELNLSGNDLTGQIDELIKLLKSSEFKFKKLYLANTKMLPEELIQLIDVITQHPTINDFSLPSCGYRTYKRLARSFPCESFQSSVAIANMLQNNKMLTSIEITCFEATDEDFATILTGLHTNKNISSLVLNLARGFSDEALAQVLGINSSLKKLKLIGNGHSFNVSMAALLKRTSLNELYLDGFTIDTVYDRVTYLGDRQLSVVSMHQCTVSQSSFALLTELPLKKLDLSHTELSEDHCSSLFRSIVANSSTLEELKLSNTATSKYHEYFLIVLAKCPRLKVLHLDDAGCFTPYDTIQCMRLLKVHNPLLQEIKFTIPERGFDDPYMSHDIWDYIRFLIEEMQLVNQTNCSGKPGTSDLEKFYQSHIANRLTSISGKIDLLKGKYSDRFFKDQSYQIEWNNTHQEILNHAIKGDYATFHSSWEQWRLKCGPVDLHLGIMMDWLDETLFFYANSIKKYNLPDHPWASAYPMVNVLSTDYGTRLDTVERYRLQDEKNFINTWDKAYEVQESMTPNSSLG